MKSNSDDKRAERYGAAIVIAIVVVVVCKFYYEYQFSRIGISHFERIDIKSTSVTKSTYMYFVTINLANTGNTNARIYSMLLNGVPYDDPCWTGTVKPLVFGDITPKTAIDVGASYSGIIIFSDDCRDPNGNQLIASWYDQYYVNVTIHTTSGKAYQISVTLPQGPILQKAPSPVVALAIVMTAIALIALFIMARRRIRVGVIKHDSLAELRTGTHFMSYI